MNNKFTYLLSVLALLFVSVGASAQNNGDYQSVGSGSWTTVSNWQVFSAGSWQAATNYPIFGGSPAGFKITIQNGDSISFNVLGGDTANRIEVMNGGILSVNALTSPVASLSINQDTLLVHPGGKIYIGGNDTLVGLTGSPSPILIDSGSFTWTSGGLQLQTITAAGSTTSIQIAPTNPQPKQLNANWTNGGTITWTTTSTTGGMFLQQSPGVTFTNAASGVINAEFSGNRGFGGGTAASVINDGIINIDSSFNINFGVNFTNAGTIQGGTAGNNATIVISGVGGNIAGNTGTISAGNGTVSGTLTIDPLLFNGNATTLSATITSTGGVGGTNYDSVVSTGPISINNAILQVTDHSGDPVNTVYTVLNAPGGITGTFASMNLSPSLSASVNATTVTVTRINTLPLTWGNFSATAMANSTVSLQWTTLQEENTSRFLVDYSGNGSTFNSIGTVTAAGNSSQPTNYSFTDAHPSLNGTNYYRLEEVDLDGNINYSGIRAVSFKNGQAVASVLASPNPAHDLLQLNVQGEGIHAIFVDALGHTLHAWILQNGYQQVSIQDVPAGEYQLIIYQNNQKIDAQHIVKF